MVLFSFFYFLQSHECLLTLRIMLFLLLNGVGRRKRDKQKNHFIVIYATPFKASLRTAKIFTQHFKLPNK